MAPPKSRAALHDDHCWITMEGEAWAIRRVHRAADGIILMLWRGYVPHIEYNACDLSRVNFEEYCDKAYALLAGGQGEKT